MPRSISPWLTATELARDHRVVYWPGPCPACGNDDDEALVYSPAIVTGHRACYDCQRCGRRIPKLKADVIRMIESRR